MRYLCIFTCLGLFGLQAFAAEKVGSAPQRHPEDKTVVLSAGNFVGTYYAMGSEICRLINRSDQGIRCVLDASDGSTDNIEKLRKGEADFVITQSDIANNAFQGSGGSFSADTKMDNLRFLSSLHDEAFTIFVRRDSNIRRVDDLVGKVINIGPLDSGMRAAFEVIFKIKGWNEKTFENAEELTLGQQGNALCGDKVDAIILAIGHPSPAVQELLDQCELRILNLSDGQFHQFIQNNPEYSEMKISHKLYRGLNEAIQTIGTKAILVSSTDMSEDLAYFIVKTLIKNIDQIKGSNPVAETLTIDSMKNTGRSIPVHPGAEKFYKE